MDDPFMIFESGDVGRLLLASEEIRYAMIHLQYLAGMRKTDANHDYIASAIPLERRKRIIQHVDAFMEKIREEAVQHHSNVIAGL